MGGWNSIEEFEGSDKSADDDDENTLCLSMYRGEVQYILNLKAYQFVRILN